MTQYANADQAEFWSKGPGQNWVTYQADLDALHEPIMGLLLAACAPRQGERVLDIGCGAGASCFALARSVAPTGHVLGVDISEPLLARARDLSRELGIDHIAFELADAQDHRFEAAGFDLVASRIGLMFFADPVAAFRNIATALRPGGRIVFTAWAAAEANPWFAWPQRIAVARLGAVAPTPPDAPGPLAFRDIDRVVGILRDAGLSGGRGEAVDTHLHHPGGIEAVTSLAMKVGPVSRMLREKNGTPEDLAAIIDAAAGEFRPFDSADGIRIPARINIFTAERG
jgi:SAM-dependent methyltransferase